MKTICIAGKNNIAVDVLDFAAETFKDCKIVSIPTRGDTGENGWQRSLVYEARQKGIDIVSLEDVYGIEDLVFVSVEFDRIIRPSKFRSRKLYNIHFSLLPAYKGCHTSVLPILHGEEKTGVTFHRMDSGIDTGEIIKQRLIPIGREDTALDLYGKLIKEGTGLVLECLPDVLADNVVSFPQSSEGSTYYPLGYIDYKNINIDLNVTAQQLRRQINAFCFRPYQLPEVYGDKIIECEILKTRSSDKPGTVLEDNEIFKIISCVDYDVKLYKDLLNELFEAVRNQDNDRARKLMQSRNLLNARDDKGRTLLSVATYNNNKEIFELLIAKGADISVSNINGTTLPMYAKDAGLNTGDFTLLRRLIESGADIKAKDFRGLDLKDYILKTKVKGDLPEDIRRLIGV